MASAAVPEFEGTEGLNRLALLVFTARETAMAGKMPDCLPVHDGQAVLRHRIPEHI